MVSRQRIFKLLTFFLLFTLLLGACQRPFPRPDNNDEQTTNETTTNESADENSVTDNEAYPAPEEDEGTAAGSGEEPAGDTGDTESETGTDEGETEETGDTPRVEEEPTPVPTETPVPEPTEVPVEETEEEAAAEETDEEEAAADEEEATADEADAAEETADTAMPNTHVVAPGENLYRIGLQYGVSWVTLAELNNLNNPNNIVVGQELQLPGEEGAAADPTPEPTPSPATETTYTVQPGDNLFRIGLRYGLSWIQIAEANGIVTPNQIYAGQVLKIPVDTPGPPPQFTHDVRQGETLFLISVQYGIPWPSIAEANDLESPYVIYPGQTLIIPGG